MKNDVLLEVVEQAIVFGDDEGDTLAHLLFVHTVRPKKGTKKGVDVQSAVYLVENGGFPDGSEA